MHFHNQERQLISLCEMRVGHGMKDASRSVAAITESHHTRCQCLKSFSEQASVVKRLKEFSEEKRVW